MEMEINEQTKNHCGRILILDKIEFKTKAITRDKEGPSDSTSGYLPEETQKH